jgi:high-affinity iron transporter
MRSSALLERPSKMLQALVITLREGVEAALIVGITLVYLSKIGRSELHRVVYLALSAAMLGSIVLAVVFARVGVNQEVFEGWVMLGAAALTASMIVFMMRTARKLRGEIETRVGGLADRGSVIGLFAFVFLMVLREGVETVLVLAAVSMNSAELMDFLGTLLGVALAVVFGVMFVKGSVRINLQKFFRITSVILFFVAAQLLISGLHELSEGGVLPASKREMALIGPIVRNEAFFFVTILFLAGLMVLFEWRRRAPLPASGTAAEQRKAQWTARRERLWMSSVYATSFLFIVLVTAQFIYAKSTTALSPATEISFVDGAARIPLAQVSDGNLHRYSATIQGTPVRFLLYQKPDGKVVATLDACQICGAVGFYHTADGIICANCAAPVNPQAVGQPGGCNPIPLKIESSGDSVVVSQAELSMGLHYFKQ